MCYFRRCSSQGNLNQESLSLLELARAFLQSLPRPVSKPSRPQHQSQLLFNLQTSTRTMPCHAKNCQLDASLAVDECITCGRGVHQICSNNFLEGDLNERVCSEACSDVYKTKHPNRFPNVSKRVVTTSEEDAQATNTTTRHVRLTTTYSKPDTLEQIVSLCRTVVPPETKFEQFSGGRHPIWRVVYALEKTFRHGKIDATHLCLLCVVSAVTAKHVYSDSWQRGLCRGSSTSNLILHLKRRHKSHPLAVKLVQEAAKRAADEITRSHQELSVHANKSVSTIHSGGRTAALTEASDQSNANEVNDEPSPKKKRTISKTLPQFFRPSMSLIKTVVVEWLTEDGLPYSTITTRAFGNMLRVATGNLMQKVIARDTFNDSLDGRFELYSRTVNSLLTYQHTRLYGMKFLTLIHDAWTCSKNTGVIGASVAFIDHTWTFRHIALVATVKNDGHTSKEVSQLIVDRCVDHYSVDIAAMAKWVMSDTTASARAVANYFDDCDQEDCQMHVLNLCIGYGIGLKDNVKTTKSVDPGNASIVVAERSIVTPGGPLPEGAAVIRKLRALNNFFSTAQRTDKLVKIQEAHNLPRLLPLVDIDVRVASTCRLMRRSILNYTAMKLYFTDESVTNVFSAITEDDWQLVREIEAITEHLAHLALSDVQSQALLASYMLLYRTMAENQLKSRSFRCLLMKHTYSNVSETDINREEVLVEDFSKPGQICLARCVAQVKERFPPLTAQDTVALLLDPRTKNCAAAIIDATACPNVHRVKLLDRAKEFILNEHIRLQQLHHSQTPSKAHTDNLNPAPTYEYTDITSDQSSVGLIFGAPVPTKTRVGYQESQLKEDAIVEFNRWMAYEEDWVNIAISQNVKGDRASLSKEMCYRHGSNVNWNLLELRKIDILRWFKDIGEPSFPIIATLARIHLGKVSSTAYQERVFSTAGLVMSPLRSQTENNRAEKQLLLRVNRREIESSTAAMI